MALEIVFAPMALEPGTFNVGDKVRVTVSFKYVIGVNTTVKLLAGPYYTNLFGKHMVSSCVGQADIDLPSSSTPADGTATVDFILIAKSLGGIENGTYGLRVWIEDTSAIAEQDNVIIVSGNTSGGDMFSSMMPMVMMLMMMGMIMPMTQQMGEGVEE
ncbi:hypothetical protein [Dehalococcoides mccartyi]|uniref:hypothetical protein n=1 Tax=Dehalococcoides mccartyi TaxID=61435 RepID=UPI0002B766A4|nr:hypothetical protein [Dehalococcoides mccartyi]AGG07379.1 hypothetical protein btf_270 [Dehalococcoides mccartyi BTF08]AQW61793.1 hypothetical protein B1779_00435 [Dehalococcoides mccartyi]